MWPTVVTDPTPYVVTRGSVVVEIIARCLCWDDAVAIAERHSGSHIHNTENGTDYYRHERKIVEYNPKEAV